MPSLSELGLHRGDAPNIKGADAQGSYLAMEFLTGKFPGKEKNFWGREVTEPKIIRIVPKD